MHSVKEKENALLAVFLTCGIKIRLSALREMRSRNSKLQKQPNKYGQVRHLMVPFSNALSLMSKNVEREKEKEANTVWIHIYLQGVFKSTSVDFNIRSTDDWLSKGGRGEGSLSNDHILFLANPCCSSELRSPNWNRNCIENVQQKSNMFSPPVRWNKTNLC